LASNFQVDFTEFAKKKDLFHNLNRSFFYLLCPGAYRLALFSPVIFFACPGGSGLDLTDVPLDLVPTLTAQFDNEIANRTIRIIAPNLGVFNIFIT
jgi:hypothetical protein